MNAQVNMKNHHYVYDTNHHNEIEYHDPINKTSEVVWIAFVLIWLLATMQSIKVFKHQ